MTNCPDNCIDCLMDHEAEELVKSWTDLPEFDKEGMPSE